MLLNLAWIYFSKGTSLCASLDCIKYLSKLEPNIATMEVLLPDLRSWMWFKIWAPKPCSMLHPNAQQCEWPHKFRASAWWRAEKEQVTSIQRKRGGEEGWKSEQHLIQKHHHFDFSGTQLWLVGKLFLYFQVLLKISRTLSIFRLVLCFIYQLHWGHFLNTEVTKCYAVMTKCLEDI